MDICSQWNMQLEKVFELEDLSRNTGSSDRYVFLQCDLGLIPGNKWVQFVVGSRPCSERFSSRYCGFHLSSSTNISKFQFNLASAYN